MPTHVDKIPVASVSRIDFASARAKKQRLDDAISCSTIEPKKKPAKPCPTVAKGSETYKRFFEELSQNCPKSAALITNEAFYKKFIPKSATPTLPKSIMDCRTEDTVSLSDGDMDELCKTFALPALTASHISAVERETRKQASSRIWFRQRAGRITASKLKQALHTTVDKPAKSLIKAICYPEANRFSSLATRYGCQHEAQARQEMRTMWHYRCYDTKEGRETRTMWHYRCHDTKEGRETRTMWHYRCHHTKEGRETRTMWHYRCYDTKEERREPCGTIDATTLRKEGRREPCGTIDATTLRKEERREPCGTIDATTLRKRDENHVAL
uniref:Uncharacterized protein n=1 Tax=Knipowitschia caucasica TaxID=637954 RepID=A0AAV2KLV3_KNICA